VLLLVACLSAACSSAGTARDLAAVKGWDYRGETVGEIIYLYCRRAAPREQLIFQWGVERTVGPHRLTIQCAD
jgi:hypothetical protein